MLDLTKIGNRISTKRKELKITQYELADKLYVTHQAVSKWENVKSIPSIEILYELTKLFHVSIDYLLDNTDIKEDDYETLFKNYPRDVVIANFLKKDHLEEEIHNIFYLLSKEERMLMINQIIHKQVCITITDIWPYLNKNERTYLLGIVLSGKCDYNLQHIYNQLSTAEQQQVLNFTKSGNYNYSLPHITIRS